MSVRDAVAKKAEAKSSTPVSSAGDRTELVRAAIDTQITSLADVLPSSTDRFARVVLAALAGNDDLVRCLETPEGQRSLILAAAQASIVGLEPNTATQDCWLEPERVKQRGKRARWECRLMIGYRGKRKLMCNSEGVETVFAEAVHEADHFVWERGFQRDRLEFDHSPDEDRGPLLWTFAVLRYEGGVRYEAVRLGRSKVHEHREYSPSWQDDQERRDRNPNAPLRSAWNLHEEDMWKKTALIELSKSADLSPDTVLALLADGVPLDVDAEGHIVAKPYEPDDVDDPFDADPDDALDVDETEADDAG